MRAKIYNVIELHLDVYEVEQLRTICYYIQIHHRSGSIRYEADRLLDDTYYYHTCKIHDKDYVLKLSPETYKVFTATIHEAILHENKPLFAYDFEKSVLGALKEVS